MSLSILSVSPVLLFMVFSMVVVLTLRTLFEPGMAMSPMPPTTPFE